MASLAAIHTPTAMFTHDIDELIIEAARHGNEPVWNKDDSFNSSNWIISN
jgi:hypothetical protein